MSEPADVLRGRDPSRRLANAIRDVKNGLADRDDVVVELRDASRMRLELLAAELAPVFNEVPADLDIFDFAVSSGLQPRLWIDAVAHVGLGRDRRTFRFLKDTRLGRVVIAESPDAATVAEHVTRYVAERIVERQRLMEGPASLAPGVPDRVAPAEALPAMHGTSAARPDGFIDGLLMVLAGAMVGFAAALAMMWDRLTGTQS